MKNLFWIIYKGAEVIVQLKELNWKDFVTNEFNMQMTQFHTQINLPVMAKYN
jgi:hypothetical protein